MRVAVVGLGRMGRRHVQVVSALGMQIAGLCDQSQQSIDATRKEFGLNDEGLYFGDGIAMLRALRVDAVVVATTAPSHCELVCEAAGNGARFILCEKPMACSLDDARIMIAACSRSGAVLAVNHQMQFMAQYMQAKALAGSPALGGLVSVLVCGSNFGLAMNASHYFEMFRYVSGGGALTVQAWLDEERVPNPRGAQFEDRAGKLRIIGKRGTSMYLDCSAAAGHGLQVVYLCRYGQIFVDELSGFVRVTRREDQYRELPTTRYGMPAVEAITHIEPADVIAPTRAVWEAMLASRPFPNGEVGLHALQCLCAAHTSHEFGGVALKIDDPRIDASRRYPWA
jgi:predicted dehydrogenase